MKKLRTENIFGVKLKKVKKVMYHCTYDEFRSCGHPGFLPWLRETIFATWGTVTVCCHAPMPITCLHMLHIVSLTKYVQVKSVMSHNSKWLSRKSPKSPPSPCGRNWWLNGSCSKVNSLPLSALFQHLRVCQCSVVSGTHSSKVSKRLDQFVEEESRFLTTFSKSAISRRNCPAGKRSLNLCFHLI